MNGQRSPSDSGGLALPWTTLLVAALAAAIAFVAAFSLTRASRGDEARPADRIRPLEPSGGRALVRDLEPAGRIPELRLSSRSGVRRAAAKRASRAEASRARPAAARSSPRRPGGGSSPGSAPTEGEGNPDGGQPPPADNPTDPGAGSPTQ